MKQEVTMNSYRSDEINHLMLALAKAQGCYKKLIPNQQSTGGKFANLSAILEAVREPLAANGLGFYQYIDLLDEGTGASLLKTMLGHESGQYISSVARIVDGKTFRETCNVVEGHRRLNALLLLGLAPSDNDPMIFDDNGVEQFDQVVLDNMKKPGSKKERIPGDTVSKEQYEDLMIELDGHEEIVKGIQQYYSITTIADLPRTEYHATLAKIRGYKKNYDNYLKRDQ